MKKTINLLIFSLFLTSFMMPSVTQAQEGQNSVISLKKARMHRLKGDQFYRLGNPSAAIGAYRKSLALDPSSTVTYFNLASAYQAKKDMTGAVRTLEKLAKLNPKDAETLYNLGCLNLYRKDLGEAKNYFEKTILCETNKGKFPPLAKNGLVFVEQLHTLDPQAQDAVILYMLQTLA